MSLNILVVDDSAVMRSMLVRTLRFSGLPVSNVYQASDVPEALTLLAAHDIDLALIDGALPDSGAASLLAQIRADGRLAGLNILMVTREGGEAPAGAIDGRGISSITMPFTPEQVRASALRSLGALDN